MTWNAAAQARLDARLPIGVRWLIWAESRDRTTGADAPIGLWTGDDHETINVDGQTRLYYGAQGEVTIPAIGYGSGTDIASEDIVFPISPEAEVLVRGRNLRFAPIDVHCALYDPDTNARLDIRRMFRGTIDCAPITTPPINGVPSLSLRLVSCARSGTITRKAKKSDQSQQARSGDRFRRYGDLGTVANAPWGARA